MLLIRPGHRRFLRNGKVVSATSVESDSSDAAWEEGSYESDCASTITLHRRLSPDSSETEGAAKWDSSIGATQHTNIHNNSRSVVCRLASRTSYSGDWQRPCPRILLGLADWQGFDVGCMSSKISDEPKATPSGYASRLLLPVLP